MKTVLRNRILELGRGEEGVALVVTLAVFMFMYIFCAGVFAVGKMVKDRICLQNAADAAAYSAAVVQADTLSRIATINRAMSWTYAQMNKRRMDFIVYRWMEHAKQHYAQDRQEAAEWVALSYGHPHGLKHDTTCYHGGFTISAIGLNGVPDRVGSELSRDGDDAVPYVKAESRTEGEISQALTGYRNYFDRDSDIVGSCFDKGGRSGIEGLERQIDSDMEAIDKMNDAEEKLIGGMYDRIQVAAREILRANIPDFTNCAYVVKTDRGATYLKKMERTPTQEYRFTAWGNNKDVAMRRYLSWDDETGDMADEEKLRNFYGQGASGSLKWFNPLYKKREYGFRWRYTYGLSAYWTWTARYCKGCSYWVMPITGEERCTANYVWDDDCNHESGCNCACDVSVNHKHSARCDADNTTLKKNYRWVLEGRYRKDKARFDTDKNNRADPLWAKPVTLREEFFEDKGTITVGVARPNANPWRDPYVLGNKDSNIGLYHAFDPFLDWMVCFSSARAGYKAVIEGYEKAEENRYCRARVENGPRDYCIDYKPISAVARKVTDKVDEHGRPYKEVELVQPTWRQRWNLCQSDWDAVMIPVCRGGSGVYEGLDRNFTYGYLREPCWKPTQTDYLWDLVVNGEWKGYSLGGRWHHFYAGTGQPLDINNYEYIDYAPGDLRGLDGSLPGRYHGWTENAVQRGGARAVKWPYQWRVSNYGRRLNWLELQKQMLH